jgi:hypothetical protein
LCARCHTGVKDSDLVFHTAVKLAVILMTATGSEDGATGVPLQNGADHVDALFRLIQIIKSKLEEGFAGFGLPVGVLEKLDWIGDAESDAKPGE